MLILLDCNQYFFGYHLYPTKTMHHGIKLGLVPTLALVCPSISPINGVIVELSFLVISHVQRPVHAYTELGIQKSSIKVCVCVI